MNVLYTHTFTQIFSVTGVGGPCHFSPQMYRCFDWGKKRLNEPFVIKIVSKIVEILAFLVLADWHIVVEQ